MKRIFLEKNFLLPTNNKKINLNLSPKNIYRKFLNSFRKKEPKNEKNYIIEKKMPGYRLYEQIVMACRSGDIEEIERYIKDGYEINVREPIDGATLLFYAIMDKKRKVLEFLLKNGANPNIGMFNLRTPLFAAVTVPDFEMVYKLVEYGADVNLIDYKGRTPIFYAIRFSGKYEQARVITRFLVEKNADLSVRDLFEETPATQAVRYADLETLKYLERKGAFNYLTNEEIEKLPRYVSIKEHDFEILNLEMDREKFKYIRNYIESKGLKPKI